MGAKRKVDEKLYNKIKKVLKTPKDDKKVMKDYGIGQTTCRAIRNSWCYADFLSRTSREKRETKKITLNDYSAQEQAMRAWKWVGLGIIISAFVALTLFVRWVLSWFGI